MSLDVYLKVETPVKCAKSGIYVRENGRMRRVSEEEWIAKNPDREPVRFVNKEKKTDCVYSANITHNLGEMAKAAGLYMYLWRPDELGITTARELIDPLNVGLVALVANPDRFRPLNPKNGWGDYEGLCQFVAAYIEACHEWPNARVEVSR